MNSSPKSAPVYRLYRSSLCLGLFLLALAYGCQSRRPSAPRNQTITPVLPQPETTTTTALPQASAWNRLWGRYDFKNKDVKLEGTWNISYNQYEFASPVSMMVRQGSWIWVSVRPALGIEVIRLVLKPDSVWMVSRPSKNYWSGTWGQLQKALQLDLDYRWFEDAILHGHGSLIEGLVQAQIALPNNTIDSLSFKKGRDSTLASVTLRWGKFPYQIHHLSMQSQRGNLAVDYLQNTSLESASLPTKMSLALNAPGHRAFLLMNWKAPVLDALSLPALKIPSDYRKLKLGS
ncbi:MAG: DUF4292 domain-containing protein [Bacteroidota bacterium]